VQTRIPTDKVTESIGPFIERLANDKELREHARSALVSAKAVYDKVQSDGPRKAAADKKTTDEAVRAASELRVAAGRLSKAKQSRGPGVGRLLLGAGIVAAAAFGVKKLLSTDADEFDYHA
jgi:hypothetical protein